MFKSSFYLSVMLLVLFTSCNTNKDDIKPADAFSMSDVIGKWKIESASSVAAGGAITIPDLFDVTSPFISGSQDALGFAVFGPNTVLEFKQNNVFEEKSGLYATPPTTTEADFGTATGKYVADEVEGTLKLTYDSGSSAAALNRDAIVVSVNATTLVLKFDIVNSGVTATNTFTYKKL